MRLVPPIARRAFGILRQRGFRALVRAGLEYIRYAYRSRRHRYSLTFVNRTDRGTRIFYIDNFSGENYNLYWLKAFRKFGHVKTLEIHENIQLLSKLINDFKPTHIHLGGSVKDNMISPELLEDARAGLGSTISVFYGDAKYSPYHCELAGVADYLYIANKTHIKINEEKGYNSFRYMVHPTDPEIFRYQKHKKVYDLIFIGNNNQPGRLPVLKRLASRFSLVVFGGGWEQTGLDHGKPVYGAKFSQTCNRAKICLAIIDPQLADLEAYFSTRSASTLASRSFLIQTYTPGLESVFTNHRHLVWYTSEDELFQLIEHYLNNEAERERIAFEGQQEVYRKYTYVKSVERILSDVKVLKPVRLHLGCGSIHLDNYINIDIQNWAGVTDMVADATDLQMFEDNTVEHIYTHALLEHIAPWNTAATLKEWYRILKPGGTIRIEVPDLERVFQDWLVNKTLEEQEAINNIFGGNKSANKAYCHQDHLTGFTYDRLTRMMAECGFENFERIEHSEYHHILVVLAQKVEQ